MMDGCCLRMASRCKQPRPIPVDVPRLPPVGPAHDCGSLSRVVMVRKTDQRLINHKRPQTDPQCEILTYETIQTYRGHKPDRTVVFREKQDLSESQMSSTPSAARFLRSSQASVLGSRTISSHDLSSTLGRIEHNNNRLSTPNINLKRQKSPSPGKIISASGFSDFQRECLKAHNEYRTKHSVPALKLNKKLCQFAEEWAKVLAARANPIHRSNSPYGENIFCSWSTSSGQPMIIDGREPVDNWYTEGVNHLFGKEPTTLKTGHFTQVIWKDTKELGVAISTTRSGQIYVVANYDPPGNFIGSFTHNVPPLGGFRADKELNGNIDSPTNSITFAMDENEIFAKGVLRYHNLFRKKHGSPELTLNTDLSALAQEWAEKLAREERFAHRPNFEYGENIYCLWSSDRNEKANPREVVRSWYEENKEFNYGVEPKGIFRAGHFSQLVWKSSKELGVGVGKTKRGKVIVVCNYNPRGNISGEFLLNVKRPK